MNTLWRSISLFRLISALAAPLALSGCFGMTNTSSPDEGSRAPYNLAYTANPVVYVHDVAITPNQLVYSGAVATAIAISPALPAGLSFDVSTGTITGTPTTLTSPADYKITVKNAEGSNFLRLRLSVGLIPPTLTYGGTTTLVYTVGSAISAITPTLGGEATESCTVSPALPAGLSLSASCEITGTPTTPTVAADYTVTAANSGGSASLVFNFTVKDNPPTISYSGSPYTFTRGAAASASATLGGGAVTSCSVAPALPAGLSFGADCSVSGSASAVGASSHTVTASNSGGDVTASLDINVVDTLPVISYTGSPFTFTKDVAISTQSVTNSGGPIDSCAVTAGALPAGLALNATTCAITGTPTALGGPTSVTIKATNTAGQSAGAVISITVNDKAPVINYVGTPYTFPINAAISAQTPSNSGGTIVSCSSSPALPAGLALSSTCVLSGTPTATQSATSYTITATNTGGNGTKAISIAVNNVSPALTYSGSPFTFTQGSAITPQTPSNTGGAATSCSSTPALPSGLSLSSACVLSGTPSAGAASASYTINAANSAGSSTVAIDITVTAVTPPTLSYAPTFVYVFAKGTAITAVTPATGGGAITSCTASPSLPPGLNLNNTSCQITGTPSSVHATTDHVITATNGGGSANQTLTITVNDVLPAISYAGAPFTFTRNSAIPTKTPTNTGGAITSCSSSPALPAGLNLSTTCVITGTPTVFAASTVYTIGATNSAGTNSLGLTIAVNDLAPTINYAGSPFTYTVGSAIPTLTPTTGGGAIVSCSSSPTLPAGLSLSSGCVLTGTPTTPSGLTTYTITATNSGGNGTRNINIRVNDILPAIAYTGSPFILEKDVLITPINATSTGGGITSCSSAPPLPTGLAISNTTCQITGTPSVVQADAAYVITASNGSGSDNKTIHFVVDEVPAIDYVPTSYNFTYDRNVAITDLTPNSTAGTITNCTVSPGLPTGLSISPTDCKISGTPSIARAAADYTVTASNALGSDAELITITVYDVAPVISYPASPATLTKGVVITPLNVSNSGGTATSCSIAPPLPSGLSFSTGTCTITGNPSAITAGADYTVTATNSMGSGNTTVNITVNDAAPVLSDSGGPYTFTKGTVISTITPTNSGGTVTGCSSNPLLPAGLNLAADCVITGNPSAITAAATYTITGTNTGGPDSFDVDITVNDVAPVLSDSGGPYTFTKGTVISTITPTNSGGPVTGCSSNPLLPAGLNLAADCVITGNPSAITAAATYTITGTNTGGPDSFDVDITVNDVVPNIAYAPSSFVHVLRTTVSSATPSNSGGVITNCVSVPGLPAGLLLDTTTCAITGSPTATQGSASYTITASNTGGNASDTISIQVKDRPRIVFQSLSALDGSTNGTAPGSSNIWRISNDGVDKNSITTNSNAGLNSQLPSFAPDGSKVLYASKRASSGLPDGTAMNSFNLWASAPDASSHALRTNNTNASLNSDEAPVYSPSGAMIAFASKSAINGANNGTASSNYNIFVANADGTGRLALTQNSTAIFGQLDSHEPSFSPDGQWIYFSSLTATGGGWNTFPASATNIWKVKTDGTSLTCLTNEASGNDSSFPIVNPAGTQVVFESKADAPGASSSYNIFTMNTDGTGRTALTTNTAAAKDSRHPRYSPDGTEIVFASKMNVNAAVANSFNIWKMASNGSSQVPLTANNAASMDSDYPQFSPDNAEIVFHSRQDVSATTANSFNIWVMKEDGTSQTAITGNTAAGLDSKLGAGNAWYAE